MVTTYVTKLLPCPFCNGAAEFERMGARRLSCIVVCTKCGCMHESGNEEWNSGASWNMRGGIPWPHPTETEKLAARKRETGG